MALRDRLTRREALAAAGFGIGLAPLDVALPGGGAKTGGTGPIRLGLNENPWGPSPAVARAIRSSLERLWAYTDREGATLVAQLAAFEGVAPEQILPGKLLGAVATRLAEQGGAGAEFVHSTPGYRGFVDAAAAAGARIVGVPLTRTLENDLDGLLGSIGARTAAAFIVNPHNPSGTVSEPQRFHDFLREAATRTLVVVDEAYLEYLDDFCSRTAARLTRDGHQVVVYRTFDKFHGLAALPIEYLVAPREFAEAMRRAGLGSIRDLNRLAVVAASAALADRAYPRRVREAVARERGAWLAMLRDRGVPHSAATASFVFFDAGQPHALAAAAFREAGIEIAPVQPGFENWIRVSIGLPAENARAREVAAALLPARHGAITENQL